MTEKDLVQQIKKDLHNTLVDYHASIRERAADISRHFIVPLCNEHGLVFKPMLEQELEGEWFANIEWAFYTKNGDLFEPNEELACLLDIAIPSVPQKRCLGNLIDPYEGPELSINVFNDIISKAQAEAKAAQDTEITKFAEQIRENLVVPFCDKYRLNFKHDVKFDFYFSTHEGIRLYREYTSESAEPTGRISTKDTSQKRTDSYPENTRLMELLGTHIDNRITLASYVREYESW